ncbi:metallophosphoesterase [Corallincola platygyrae]|uniref:Metallophosphoesterase n=1 Tax=Corallincola platygyrae TaxID=1193278 RepID=A0ABW4XJP0_9GAMM
MLISRITLKCLAFALLVITSFCSQARPDTYLAAQPEVYAIGDLHGDYSTMVKILRAAKLIDGNNNWIGGSRTLVQVGDQLDRGDTEKEILDLFESLIVQARDAGGNVLVLNGNHETMNVELDFRYVTSAGFRQFSSYYHAGVSDSDVLALPSSQRGRAVAFKPGGPYARKLAEHNAAVMIGETVYVHGGITTTHANYGLENINAEISHWMKGNASRPWSVGGSGPLWNRDFGGDLSSSDCSELQQSLDALGAKRMVIAHTRQNYINQACNGRVWRIDVGMSNYYGGRLQALKITNDSLIQIVESDGSITDTGFGDGDNPICSAPGQVDDINSSDITATSFRATWSAVSGAAKYTPQLWIDGAWVSQSPVMQPAVSYQGFVGGSTQYIRVIAEAACGAKSAGSNWLKVELASGDGGGGGCDTPEQPDQPWASNVTSSSYTLLWNSVGNATSYTVQRWSASNGAWQNVGTTTATRYDINGEARDKAYARVIPINACGEQGTPSNWVTVELQSGDGSCSSAPSTPTGLRVSGGVLSWSATEGASYYKVVGWNGSAWETYVTTSETRLSITQSTPQYLAVSARNDCGKSDYSSYIQVR